MAATLLGILLLSPLVGFLFNGILQCKLNYKLAGTVATVAIASSFVCSVLLFMQVSQLPAEDGAGLLVNFFSWLNLSSFQLDISFLFDRISGIMALVITGVGSLIHIFSIGYMSHDEKPAKYFAYLNLFVFNMLLLVLGSNLVVMFVGWEGVGLCSYLLIGFWYKDVEKSNAGMKAFIANRIGDAGLLLGMFLLFQLFGSLDFLTISQATIGLDPEKGFGLITAICLLLFVGATGKSAQIPLYVWLPDAMAGPTPVSALIHAATMVTAGVYMIVRLSHLFILSPIAMACIAIVGALTALFAATIGTTQWDIKKILAYSTVSQLGYMFLACGVGAFGAAMFHLMTHAFFKALMFLGSGSVIHAMHEEQDIRKMGGLKKYLPITHATFVMGWLAIIGTPLFSGFFSKDEILWMSFHSPRGHWALWVVGVLAAACTAFYMTRLMALTFWGASRVPKETHPHESPLSMTFPLIVLGVLSVIGGWIGIPHVIGHSLHIPNILAHWLEPMVAAIPGLQEAKAWQEYLLMFVSVSLAGLSAWFAYVNYVKGAAFVKTFVAKFPRLHSLVYDKYRVDEAYDKAFVKPTVEVGKGLWTEVDVSFIDKITYKVSDWAISSGDGFRSFQSGSLQQYAMYIVLGLVVISSWILW
ncbi:MAG: NADH-quinone oxidoreductase subunit L [Bdellovibrionales bacterium CG10_big_fil_rev_8_21_14_0_10_45_34]|nr:MAG: NADH-quinone oxidoreductase subunit L [Bdellovibrionales bacterium CG10_big_fil_rev_8_21_14_0_10_45_34]